MKEYDSEKKDLYWKIAGLEHELKQYKDIEKEFEIDDLEDLRDRLTKYKFMANHEMSCVDVNAYNLMLKDLNEHNKIEKELGIDLITLFKALQQDYIWVREHNTEEKEIVCERVRLNYLNHTLDFVEPRKEIGKGRNLLDYGYSWALTKEELENEED